jgi:hypothetical protein
MSPYIIGQIFGVLVIIVGIVSNQMPKRWQMLLGMALMNLLSIINIYLIGGGLAVCLVCAVAVIQCPINAYRAKKELPTPKVEEILFCVLYLVTWGIGYAISVKNGTATILDFIPLVATIFFIGATVAKTEKGMRLCMLGNYSSYIIYQGLFKNIAVIAQIVSAASVVIALYRYKKQGGEKNEN